ncbi:MAG: flagellin lysine-N-methylase [Clostridia bacterium]|nr:flagellin lysine-N-methylase [Clostridia bacterium]
MKTVSPQYYNEFRCIADKCVHNCCIGWEIDIDEQTLSKYSLLGGKLASKLKDCICKNSGDAHFILDDDDRCPFLCEDGLCELIKEAGDDLLCDICNEHPRYHNYYSDRVESGIGLCCEEAARIIVCHSGKISLADNGASESCNEIERLFFERRQNIFDIIQDANSSIDEKLHILERRFSFKCPSLSMQECANILLHFEHLDTNWPKLLRALKSSHCDFAAQPLTSKWNNALSNLCHYFIFRHLPCDADESEFCAVICYAFFSLKVILALTMCNSDFSIDTLIEIARMYSAEVEYSDENYDSLIDLLKGCKYEQ